MQLGELRKNPDIFITAKADNRNITVMDHNVIVLNTQSQERDMWTCSLDKNMF